MCESLPISLRLATHLAETPASSVSPAAIAAAKRALIDGLGVMLGASGLSPDVRPFIALAQASGTGGATILGVEQQAAAAMAALANGAMAHALDFEDSFDAAPCHPDASLLPAVLAIAETQGPVHGHDLLAAIAIGCDLVCRLALCLTRSLEEGGWYPPPILGAFGATAAAGRLLRLDARQMLDALSLTLSQATCPGEIKHSRNTVIRAIREAFPAQAAVTSVLLARDGVPGFERPFEGEAGFFQLYAGGMFDPEVLLRDLGRHFWIEELSFKRWPACRGTHAFIEMAQQFHRRPGFDLERIREVVADIGQIHRMLIEPAERKMAPSVAIDAKFSLPFTIAATLIHGEVTLETFSPDRLEEQKLRALSSRIRFVERSEIGPTAGALELVMQDGERWRAAVNQARGHPSQPLTDTELVEKFQDCAARAAIPWSAERAANTCAAIDRLDQSDDAMAGLGLWKGCDVNNKGLAHANS